MQSRKKKDKNRFAFGFYKSFSAVCFVFIVFSPAFVFAKTLNEYRNNVREARDLIFQMLYPDNEEAANENTSVFDTAALTKIRKSVPANEIIEWEGGDIETNNQWLIDELDEFEKEAADSPKREAILSEVAERLVALEQKLAELEKPAASSRAKDEDKQKLAEILRREEYQKPAKAEESIFQKLYRRFMEWLAGIFSRSNLPAPAASGFQSFSFVLQIVLYALVLGVIGFLIYKFAPFLAGRFLKKEKAEKKERVVLGEKLLANQTSKDLFDEAEKLALAGNLRGAIRKDYIALLCELSDRKILGLSRHKTNRDYLRDVQGKTELYKNLNGLTINFERHWYGFERAEKNNWEEFRENCKKTISTNN